MLYLTRTWFGAKADSQVLETVIHKIGHQTLQQILVLSAERVAGARTPGKAAARSATTDRSPAVFSWRTER
jgi:hypothetical protein